MSAPIVMWFRRDLRLADNEALSAAVERGVAVVPVYVAEAASGARAPDPFAPGRASRAWLAASLRALDESLRERGSRLTVVSGPAAGALARLARDTGARDVHCTRDWTSSALAEETTVAEALEEAGARLDVHEGQLLSPPPALRTGDDGPYRVFTPYHRAWARSVGTGAAREILPPPDSLPAPAEWPSTAPQPDAPPHAPDITRWWTPGEAGARTRLATFVRDALAGYADTHDRADLDGTSRLSPHLAFGEISPRRVVAAVTGVTDSGGSTATDAARVFVRQLTWREFAYHVMHAFPTLAERPLRSEFSAMPWAEDPAGIEAWREGRTGFPLVDAGMRELAQTGWMHNRARLVTGSFLAKDLLVRWQEGEVHFADALVDADTAVNAFSWQWVAGSGADAAPYFRIFNPALQGAKVDPDGAYVRHWVPELAEMPARWVHRPHEAPADVLAAAGVTLGRTYPRPMVDHAEARTRALEAYEAVKAARRR